ncbi:hypothetical protein [Niveibacterium terrae]|uniref:hypothetical protein n=1 Tax=Niveibacterium terrae TaxID=3373598 RepID=UPI003A9128D9
MIRILAVSLVLACTGCTVIHVIGDHGNVTTHYWPGIAYIQVTPHPIPLYLHQRTLGLSLTNHSWAIGFDQLELVSVRRDELKSCLLISMSDTFPGRDFSFQLKEPEHVCKPEIHLPRSWPNSDH